MALQASGQITLVDLTDAYSVILSLDSYTFAGNTTAVSATQSVTIEVTSLVGPDKVNCTVGTCTAKNVNGATAAGVSVAIADNNTDTPKITITATTSCNLGGIIYIPVTVKDIIITKSFSFAIALKGANGVNGTNGQNGRGIASCEIRYQVSNSGSTVPTGTWSTDIPSATAGQYVWTRMTLTYTDGSTPSVSYSVGKLGTNGTNGTNGADGRGIASTTIGYQLGNSGNIAPTGTWSSSVPTPEYGKYLWTKTVTTYTSGTPSTSYSVSYIGINGIDGTNGTNGQDAIILTIVSSNGIIFKNSSIATTLTANVYKGGVQLSDKALTALGAVKWYKNGDSTAVGTGTTLIVSSGDITDAASFTAQLEG